jgi:hypothetical protein
VTVTILIVQMNVARNQTITVDEGRMMSLPQYCGRSPKTSIQTNRALNARLCRVNESIIQHPIKSHAASHT